MGKQNTSHAVMAQRFEAKDSLDDFPTPPWATRALLEHVIPDKNLASLAVVLAGVRRERAVGRGVDRGDRRCEPLAGERLGG